MDINYYERLATKASVYANSIDTKGNKNIEKFRNRTTFVKSLTSCKNYSYR